MNRKYVTALLAIMLLITLIISVIFSYSYMKINRQITRIDVGTVEDTGRPEINQNSMNFLILGTDARNSDPNISEWEERGQRSDTIMIIQVEKISHKINVLEFQRDTWVDIPGYGKGKLNWAYSYGGMPLAIRTVENFSGIRIDHCAVANFNGFVKLTDAVGGVDMSTTTEGTKHYDGKSALNFVRERYKLPNGNFDRTRRQMLWIQAIYQTIQEQGILKNAAKINSFIDILSESIVVDRNFEFSDVRQLMKSFYNMADDDLLFISMPNKGVGTEGDQSIVIADPEAMNQLADAWRTDQVSQFVRDNPKILTLDKGQVF
ncbi:LytR family transcriptional regulator [Corynebacterium sp. 3HC-13]|uniref:LCP family protein n=1 Tax=Corynebacterium poyangense TaxID=2684405 RepID=UPI001CCFCECB|nr:LCP family protein [Corynebacterium poyangense]MBZ8177033.1 LytR family transcriptional regulator [Corynebacterium poyangense]